MSYGILLPAIFAEHDPRGVLAIDYATGLPAVYSHRSSAARAMVRSMSGYLASSARVVKLTISTVDDLPTYRIG